MPVEKERHPEQSSRCRFSENSLNNKVNKCLKWYILQICLYFFKSLSYLLVSIILLNHVMYIIFNIAFLVVEMLKCDSDQIPCGFCALVGKTVKGTFRPRDPLTLPSPQKSESLSQPKIEHWDKKKILDSNNGGVCPLSIAKRVVESRWR